MDILIREYRPADWPRMMEIHDEARMAELRLAGLTEAFVPLSQAAFSEGLFDYTILVALADEMVAGFVAYSCDELAWLYVDPALARRGIGTLLVKHVIKSTMIRPLNVEVLAGNDPAINLYKSMGFVTTEIRSGKMPGNESFHVSACIMHME